MTTLERKAWLTSLKEGDEVAVVHNDHDSSVVIRTIILVQTDRIVWQRVGRHDNCTEVKGNGRLSSGYGKWRIEPVTDEVRATIRARENRNRLNAIRWEKVSDYVIACVISALDQESQGDH